MHQPVHKISSQQARTLFPLQKLTLDDTEELLRTSIITQLTAGTVLFSSGDLPKQIFYLISGEIELQTRNKGTLLIKSGTPAATKPLGRGIAGQLTATASQPSQVISVDADMLELFLSWTNPNAGRINEMQAGHEGEWLERLLQSRGLQRFSEEHIQILLNRINEVHHRAGDVIIQQGDNDQYYYIIKNGRCSVTRQPQAGEKVIKLAELRQGDAFGEEALLANTPRSANITMMEDGALMRLTKADFSKLMAQPLLHSIHWSDSQYLLASGGTFLDIRLPDEFETQHLPGSINIPLALLRLRLKQLDPEQKYIVCCDDGHRSAIATFLLNRHGFNAFILDGGIASILPNLADREVPSDTDNNPWGNNHHSTMEPPFNDVPGIENIHKTPPSTIPKATITPIHRIKPEPILRDIVVATPPPIPTPAPETLVIEALTVEEKNPHRNNTLKNIIIAIAVAATLITTIALATAPRSNSTPNLNTTPPAVPTAPSATTMDSPHEATYLPWSDNAENQLSELVGLPLNTTQTGQ